MIPFLAPGSGWSGATTEPGQIGTGTAKAIARWDVVPYQTIADRTMTVGVVAFHIAGIDRVAFSVDGGAWSNATAMGYNGETGVVEYRAKISADLFSEDGPIEVRAIAYPKSAAPQADGTGAYPGGGYPRLLDSLFLYVDRAPTQAPNIVYADSVNGLDTNPGTSTSPTRTLWRAAQIADTNGGASEANGATVYLKAGVYTWDRPGGGAIPGTSDRWLTIEPAPGVATSAVSFDAPGWYPGTDINLARLRRVTLRAGISPGQETVDRIWLDQVVCDGPGAHLDLPNNTWCGGFLESYWTGCAIEDSRFGIQPAATLARDCLSQRTMLGLGDPKLVVNSAMHDVEQWNLAYHPDVIAWNFLQSYTPDNAILYGITSLSNQAEGIFWKDTHHMKNVALVNVLLDNNGPSEFGGGTSQDLDHLLMWNVSHHGSFTFERPESDMTNVSIRGTEFWGLSLASGAGVNAQWFDSTHYVANWSGYITPGTNVTTGDPVWGSDYAPDPGSPLLNRVVPLTLRDLLGATRTNPTSVGAIQ